ICKSIYSEVVDFWCIDIFHIWHLHKCIHYEVIANIIGCFGCDIYRRCFYITRMNQALAIVGDFAGILLLYWLIGGLVVDDGVSPIMPALAAAYFGTMAEAIYHIYAMDRLHEPDIGPPLPVRYQTEFAEEEEVDDTKKDNNEDSSR